MDISQEVEELKKELVAIIVGHLKDYSMDVPKAQVLAADFLDLLPIADQKELLTKLKELGARHAEAQELYVEELGKVEASQKDTVLTNMRNAIATGNIDQAISHAKSMQQGV